MFLYVLLFSSFSVDLLSFQSIFSEHTFFFVFCDCACVCAGNNVTLAVIYTLNKPTISSFFFRQQQQNKKKEFKDKNKKMMYMK